MIQGKRKEYYRVSLFLFAARIFYTAAIPVLLFWVCLFNGARITGIQNLKGIHSAVTVCNHVHKMDSVLVAAAFYPRKLVFPTVPKKIDKIFPGVFFNLLGCVSVPRTFSETQTFFGEMEKLLDEGRIVHFFPEGFISPYGAEIHSFKRGAFFLAAKAHVPLLPMAVSFHEPRGFYKLFKRKPVMCLVIGEQLKPVSPDAKEDERMRMKDACERITEMLSE